VRELDPFGQAGGPTGAEDRGRIPAWVDGRRSERADRRQRGQQFGQTQEATCVRRGVVGDEHNVPDAVHLFADFQDSLEGCRRREHDPGSGHAHRVQQFS